MKRNAVSKVLKLLDLFPVVAILGVRQCGKTQFCKDLKSDWEYVDLENPQDFDRIEADPVFFFEQHPKHLILDEVQEAPKLFPIIRGVIDRDRSQKGRFLLTGSSSPELIKNISESLAGRVAVIEMGTFKANELYGLPISPFFSLFEGADIKQVESQLKQRLNNHQIQRFWLRGGYPEPILHKDPSFYPLWMQNYFDTYIQRDIRKLFPKLNSVKYRRFIQLLGQLSGTIINRREVSQVIEVSEPTVRQYIDIAHGTFVWRNLPSYERNVKKSVIKMPKGHIRDSGLLHYLLRISQKRDLGQHPHLGRSFESFAIEEILKGIETTSATNWQPYFYRTRNRAEIDLIVEGTFGTIPIEMKHGVTVGLKSLTTLRNFVKEHNLPYGLLVNHASRVEWLTKEVLQVPVTCL